MTGAPRRGAAVFLAAVITLTPVTFWLQPVLASGAAQAADWIARALWPDWVHAVRANGATPAGVLRLAGPQRALAAVDLAPAALLLAPSLAAALAGSAAKGVLRRVAAGGAGALSAFALVVLLTAGSAAGAAARLAGSEPWPYRLVQVGEAWIMRPADASALLPFAGFWITEPSHALAALSLISLAAAWSGLALTHRLPAWRERLALHEAAKRRP